MFLSVTKIIRSNLLNKHVLQITNTESSNLGKKVFEIIMIEKAISWLNRNVFQATKTEKKQLIVFNCKQNVMFWKD